MLPEEFSKEMWECWRDVSVAYGTFAKKIGVDTSELYVVDALWDEPEGLSQRSICEACDMGKQTISAICKRLAARDVVVANASQADKRERIMALTDEGREQWRLPIERMRELEMKAAAAISPEEAVLFVKVIKQYAKTFQEGVQQ
ncbi:MarR family winged helix-turn-helix transcriptional regulator [Senegalimassilia anaerobia]